MNEPSLNCPLCRSTLSDTLATRGRDGEDLHTVLCQRCGLVFTSPVPTAAEVDRFYASKYRAAYKGVREPKLKHVWRAGLRAVSRVRQLDVYCPGSARVLEIGSGGGEFLYFAHRRGHEVLGIEADEGYGRFSKREYGLDVRIGPIAAFDLPEAHFDYAAANHVIEHLREPVAVFAKVRRALRPGGHFAVEVPNVESCYHAPHNKWHFAHILNFNPVTLEYLGRRTGFEVVECTLQPATQHVNMVFRQTTAPIAEVMDIQGNAARVRAELAGYSNSRHYLSATPAKRLWCNLRQALHELYSVKRSLKPRELLDRIYEEALSPSTTREM